MPLTAKPSDVQVESRAIGQTRTTPPHVIYCIKRLFGKPQWGEIIKPNASALGHHTEFYSARPLITPTRSVSEGVKRLLIFALRARAGQPGPRAENRDSERLGFFGTETATQLEVHK
jgi:hypothetical protein